MTEKNIAKEIEEQENMEIIKMISDALEKQVAKTPILLRLQSGNRIYACPVCQNPPFPNQKYCDECGQKLKW